MAPHSESPIEQSTALLPPFLALIDSSNRITIPPSSLYGGITHFLSTLSANDGSRLLTSLLTSPSLPPSADLRYAIRLSVSSKISAIQQSLAGAYLPERRIARQARRWLDELARSVLQREASRSKLVVLLGLVEGMQDNTTISWGSARSAVEDEVILSLAEELETDDEGSLELLCAAMLCTTAARLRALDLKSYVAPVNTRLLQTLRSDRDAPTDPDAAAHLSRALARFFAVLNSGGPSSRHHAWDAMRSFVGGMKPVAMGYESESHTTDLAWDDSKTAFFAFLTPSLSILDILLEDDHSARASTDMAIGVLVVLCHFSSLTERAAGGLEGYERLLYGILDVFAAKGTTRDIGRLFKLLAEGKESDSRAAFTLLVGEQLLGEAGHKTVDNLLSLCQRHIAKPSHRASFEASHAFLLALVESSSRQPSQKTFACEIIFYYSDLLLKQAQSGDISADQLRSAYLQTTQAASRLSPSALQSCLHRVDSSKLTPEIEQTRRLLKISLIPYIPITDLETYLGHLATSILDTPQASPPRQEILALAFKTILEELGDEGKDIGMRWWLEWKDTFQRSVPARL
ncbi:hypothetical protein P7C73_g5984, partial [Tremellales sp. Uapishka_1]